MPISSKQSGAASIRSYGSNPNPLDFGEADVIAAPVVETGGFGFGMSGPASCDRLLSRKG